MSFIAIHYVYITSWVFLASLILYLPGGIRYIDALLLASGAATQSGQNPVDLNRLHTNQQLTLWMVAMVTNVIFVNSLLVLVRLSWFRKRFRSVVGEAKAATRRFRDATSSTVIAEYRGYGTMGAEGRGGPEMQKTNHASSVMCDEDGDDDDIEQPRTSTPRPINQIAASSAGPHITFDVASQQQHREQQQQRHRRASDSYNSTNHQKAIISSLPPLTWETSIASYSDWDETQKDELGGTEYRALKTLFFILMGYFVIFHLLGILSLLCVILSHPQYAQIVDNIGVPQTWWAIFTAASAFNDVGFTLTPNSMVSFNKAPLLLLVMTFLIVIGNTGFPCMLRLIIWALAKITNRRREELDFLLRHPRRCFTLLFPGVDTWRLLGVLLVLNAVDLAIFLLLDVSALPHPPTHVLTKLTMIKKKKPPSTLNYTWLMNGLFQVASTRTAGFTVTSLADLHPAVQISFVVMMYISAFPTAIAMRKTNVYEERSLGIYDSDTESTRSRSRSRYGSVAQPQHPRNDLGYHIQKQLSFDLWYIALGTFLIAVVEGDRLQDNHQQEQRNGAAFSLFSILFEVVSGYGTVGLSLGYAWTETSICAQFRDVSKVVILAMQVRGRHRGLPYALDHAVLLPWEMRSQDEDGDDEDGEEGNGWKGWLRRRRSNLSSLLSISDDGENENERERVLP